MIISVEDNDNLLILGLIIISDDEDEITDNREDNEFGFFIIILDEDIEVVNFDSKFDVSKDIFDDEINEFNDWDIFLSSDNGIVLWIVVGVYSKAVFILGLVNKEVFWIFFIVVGIIFRVVGILFLRVVDINLGFVEVINDCLDNDLGIDENIDDLNNDVENKSFWLNDKELVFWVDDSNNDEYGEVIIVVIGVKNKVVNNCVVCNIEVSGIFIVVWDKVFEKHIFSSSLKV